MGGNCFNKKSNAQGGQSRVNPTPVNSAESNYASAARAIPNGTNVQPQYHGGSDVSAPASQPPYVSSDSAAPTTPAKGDASKASPFQFGSISPGFMNGMAARHDSSRPSLSVPTAPVPKQQPANKDTGVADLSKAGDTHIETRAKKDPLVSPLPPASQMQKPSVIPLTGISMAMPYHQSQAPVHFGAPNPQIQSQGMSTASLQMPLSTMPLPIGSASQMKHRVFVPSLQPHPIHPQGITHQGQSMCFTPQMGHQLPHQLGNMGMGINPQFSPQQGGKFAGPRKTTPVKITHPNTHEELRLDKRADAYSDGGPSGARCHSFMPSQSPPVQPFAAAHPVGYYPSSSYTTSYLFYSTPSSLPLSSSQITTSSQPPRFNYAVSQGPQNASFVNSSSHNSLSVNKSVIPIPVNGEPPNPESSCDAPNAISAEGKKKRKGSLLKADAAGSTSDLYNAYKGPEEKKEAVVSSENIKDSKVKTTSKGKKKRKEILQKADATGSTSYLYNAYKGPEEKKEDVVSSENTKDSKLKTTSKGKKKLKEILRKADAARTTSYLYNAYKGPEEKKEAVVSSENSVSVSTSGNLKQLPMEAAQTDAIVNEQCGQKKTELDDWEDAADMSTPKLEVSDITQQVGDGSEVTAKKYSRDFLLKFAGQCTDLPEGFKITSGIAEALMSSNISSHFIEHDSHPSTGRITVGHVPKKKKKKKRITDRSGGMSQMDFRGSDVIEEDKWNKVSNAFHSGMPLDGSGGNTGFRPGQGGNFGILRNPCTQTPMQYTGRILSGPMQSMVNQGGMQINSPDGERWQRAASFQQRGLIPSPNQSPLWIMHKAEKKYEVGKVADEEQAKQRQLKGILNKLTPQNFEKLFEQVKAVNIDNAVTLTGVISQIFEKALMEPTFCEMYVNFCFHLAAALPDLSQDNEKITFKKLLLNKCQEEFESGEREQEEANKADEGEVKQTDEEREEKRTQARRRMLGNIRLIEELYKKRMLTDRIMHGCIKKLLGQYHDPDEEDIEALCKLMSTIGEKIDHPRAKMDAYFERMKSLSNNMNLSSRVRFMLKDAIDLRKNKWQQRRKVEGPKKIEEVLRDASQERQAQAGRLGRGPGNIGARRVPMDFGPRGSSLLSSPNAQMGGLHGLPTQVRGFGSQDARMVQRQSYEARTLSIPLPQRPLGDNSITLGPQGGLAKGMSIRGPTAVSSSTGINGYSNLPEHASYSSREDPSPRCVSDRFAGPTAYDQSGIQEHNMNYGNKDLRNSDRILDSPVVTSPSARAQGTAGFQNTTSEGGWSEEKLHNMSMAAIREYYRDVNEVILCVKDLNSPSFHPSMVSLWITDSFERKDTERDLLAQLLINLVKSHGGTLSQAQVIGGFESVLTTLEDVVMDVPKAPEFLGRIFAKAIIEHVVSLKEIGRLIHDGGEEPGSLLQIGLAADVLGSTLEVIQSEKGDSFLNEIQTSSNLQLETFMPSGPVKSCKLEKFI